MRIAIGSDERTSLTDHVLDVLRARSHQVEPLGALGEGDSRWPVVAREVAERVAGGACDLGILFCWTGTGVSIAANKVSGVRAALCADAETARGARRWNDANVLCMSLRATASAVAEEIIQAWLDSSPEESEQGNIALLASMDSRPVA
jgi:ribose 5-phosphate isomerase B